MKIGIFGAGYVGLVTGAALAELGNEVVCCDVDVKKIKGLLKKRVPFYESGLREIVSRNQRSGRLKFTSLPKSAVLNRDIIFIAVGTPAKPNGQTETSFVLAVAKTIGGLLANNNTIVATKSTVPLGFNSLIKQTILSRLKARGLNISLAVVSNPEFLRQGRAIKDFMKPDRVVVGVEEKWAKNIMAKLYAPLTKNGHPIFFTDLASSEISKYAANTFIASRISLINELSRICEAVGADVEIVRQILGSDSRIGSRYIYPGIGYGGSCLPKDVRALANIAKRVNLDATLIKAVENVNKEQKTRFARMIINQLRPIKGKTVAVWGLSFKPRTDDMRGAPAVDIINALLRSGAKIQAFDPVARDTAKRIFGNKITITNNMYGALKNAAALAVVTEWPDFEKPDFEKIKTLLNRPLIYDGRNIYDPTHMKELGFHYISIGRPKI